MVSERVQRRIDRLLDQAEEAADRRDWPNVAESVQMVLALDDENADARAFQAMLDNAGVIVATTGDASPDQAPTFADPTLSVGEGEASPGDPGRSILPQKEGHGGDPAPISFAGGRYQVSKFLGEGGKKRVYEAHDTLLDRGVAFALIKTDGFDQTSKERISREAQAMGRLGVHPNIVAVLDLGQEDDGSPYMVTELMGGGDVEALLELDGVGAGSGPPTPSPQPSPASGRGGKFDTPQPGDSPLPAGEGEEPVLPRKDEGEVNPTSDVVGAYGNTPGAGPSRASGHGLPARTTRNGLPLERTIEIGKAVCEGLEFAHARGIVHRDLKPGNVWLTEDGVAKIGDFGLAVMTDRTRLTREGMMVGTVSYMPPEQATGGEITPKADLYSLGAMLYEMVTGRPPFLGDDEIAIIGQHINTPPVAPTWHNGNCPRPLEALIMRLLAKNPGERPESAQDVFNALDTIDLTARGETVERDASSLESLAGGVFVGRQAEMDQLKAALENVLGGSGRLVTLVGEPGIGKTRTSEELATYAGLRGAQVLWGRCYETGGQPPYWPWVQAIRSYVREIDPDELRRQMGSSASVVAEIVTDVKDRLPDIQAPPKLDDPDSARFRLFDSITSFLKSASRSRPLVLILDDLHWSDGPSLTFLEFLAREMGQSRVLIIATYRDMELNRRHPLTVTLGDLNRERLFERVLLRGLTAPDIERFIEITAGGHAPKELSATVHRHTEGNPLFVTEVVRDLVQSGELAENRQSGSSTWSVRIPEGVREVIGRRLDRLSERANEVLTTASVVGRDFRLAALGALANDTTEGQLLDVIDEALDARIIEELTDEVGHYQFTHALMQETLIGELSLTRRVRLHARIAQTLEQLYGISSEDHAEELAHHFGEAEAVLGTEKLAHYSILAGESSLRAFAPETAIAYFERVTASFNDGGLDSARFHWGIGRAMTLTAAGKVDGSDALDHLIKAFELYESAGDVEMATAIAIFPRSSQQSVRGVSDLMDRALRLHDPGTRAAGMIQSLQVPYLVWDTGDHSRAEQVLAQALTVADKLSDTEIESAARLGEAVLAMEQVSVAGNERQLETSNRGLEILVSGSNPSLEAVLNRYALLACSSLGMSEDAIAYGRKSREIGRQTGDRAAFWYATINLIEILSACGRWIEADQTLEDGSALVREARLQAQYAMARVERGLIEDPSDLTQLLGQVSSDSPIGSIKNTFHAMIVSRCMPELKLTDGIKRALGKLSLREDYVQFLRTHEVWRLTMDVTAGLQAIVDRDIEEARIRYERIAPSRGQLLFVISIDRVLGLLCGAMSDLESAVDHFLDAMEFCRGAGYRPELAWTCSDYAEMLLDRAEGASSTSARDRDRSKAIELQDEALAITQELGMRPLTERILARRSFLGRMRA